MNATTLTHALEDSIEIEALAKVAGITRVEARRFLAALYDLEAVQYLRMMKTCADEAGRQRERAKRLRR